MLLLIVGLVVFLGVHSLRIFVPQWRLLMIDRLGQNGWKGVSAFVSLVGFVLLIYGFGEARMTSPILYQPPKMLAHFTILLMLFAMIFLVASLVPAGRIATMVKHPMVLAVKIWAFAHLLANGDVASVILFGTFLVWGVLERISLKKRARAGENVVRPFVSIKGDIVAIVIGIILYLAILLKLHEWLIGVQPIAGLSAF